MDLMEEPHSKSLIDDSEEPPQGCSSNQPLDLQTEHRSRSFAEAYEKGFYPKQVGDKLPPRRWYQRSESLVIGERGGVRRNQRQVSA